MKKQIIIMGNSGEGLLVATIEMLKAEHPDLDIISEKEALKRGLEITKAHQDKMPFDESIPFKAPPILENLQPYFDEIKKESRRKGRRSAKNHYN